MTDDTARNRILGQIQELRAELGNLRDRPHARRIKGRLVDLRGESLLMRSNVSQADLVSLWRILDEFIAEAQATITRVFGTSAWDEPETVEEALARTSKAGPLPASPASEPPLTDEDLGQIERAWAGSPVVAHTCGNCGAVNRLATDTGRENIVTAGVPRLAAEVRRLRSDEWLRASAQELLRIMPDTLGRDVALMEIVAILRKHRDGKA